MTQEKLDEQRGVVQNEKRQGEHQPYAIAYRLITENTYPEGHPYAHPVIGSMEDLEAAPLEDVHEWFQTYGAANAVVEQQTSELAGSWETIGAVGTSISDIVRYGLRDDYDETRPDEVREMKLT